MRIGLLSRGVRNYATRRLIRAANALGHRVTLLDPFNCTLALDGSKPWVTHNGRSVDRLDVLLPRLSPQTSKYGLEVIAHFELAGVRSVNSSASVELARHKWRSLRALSKAGLPIPPSFAAGSTEFLDKPIARVGGYPFLIKPFEGTQGVGMMLFETPLTAKSALDTLWNLRQDYVAQQFYAEAAGHDVRALVIGDCVVGAMERIATEGDFRANVHRGGLGKAVTLSDPMAELAVRATQALGLEIAGVDMLTTHDGPVILEANPSPGFEGFEQATKQDVAHRIIEYVAQTR
ncbi:RimK family alpha-L-glutamate ligase [Candidatus Poribacteria bacterium]|nr:RimK family alpha-L-glutamate ligase [Candidatus Poribacteria bacterium]